MALLAACCALLAGCASAGPAAAPATAPAAAGAGNGLVAVSTATRAPTAAWPYYGTRIEPAVRTPDFVLTDTGGARYQPRARTTGRIVTLFFGYTHCPDECPTTMADIAAALQQLPARVRGQVTVLFVTVDPARDTAPVLRAWLDRFDRGFIGLTGALATVDADARSLGIAADPPATDAAGATTVDHGTETLVFGRDGIARFVWSPATTVAEIEHDLARLAVQRSGN